MLRISPFGVSVWVWVCMAAQTHRSHFQGFSVSVTHCILLSFGDLSKASAYTCVYHTCKHVLIPKARETQKEMLKKTEECVYELLNICIYMQRSARLSAASLVFRLLPAKTLSSTEECETNVQPFSFAEEKAATGKNGWILPSRRSTVCSLCSDLISWAGLGVKSKLIGDQTDFKLGHFRFVRRIKHHKQSVSLSTFFLFMYLYLSNFPLLFCWYLTHTK